MTTLNAANPLGYMGVNYTTNPPLIPAQRAPTTNDIYPIGTIWADESALPATLYTSVGNGVWESGGNAVATTTSTGIVQLATLAQLEAGTAPSSYYVPSANDVFTFVESIVVGVIPDATTVVKGIGYLATNAQAVAGVLSDNHFIVPANLPAVFAAPPALGGTTPAAVTSTSLTSVGTISLNASGTAATTIGGSSGAITVNVGAGNFSVVGAGNTIGIGNDAAANTISIGSATGAAQLNLLAGTGNMTLSGATATTITIGKSDGTGTITLGSSSASQTVEIAGGAGVATVNIGKGIAGNTISIGNGANTSAQTINIGSGASGANSTVNILAGNGSAGAQTANIVTGTRAGAVNIGNNAAHVVTIGSTTGAASTTIRGGTNGIVITPTSGNISVAPATQSVASPTASATQNSRLFSITFTGFTTASAGTQDFTITNSTVLTTSGVILSIANLNASTNNAQMSIVGVTQAAGSVIVHTKNNGAGALGAGDDVIITGWVIN